MEKPNGFSVTDQPCRCGILECLVDNPDLPITYDPKLQEYNLEYGGKGRIRFYHCPMCGGAAPASKRREYPRVPSAEEERLRELLRTLHTPEDVIRVLGPPDEDDPVGTAEHHSEHDGSPARIQYFRTMRYRNISETADLAIAFSHAGMAHFCLYGKSTGDGPDAT